MDISYDRLETWQKFALLEMAMDRLQRKKHMTALIRFVRSKYDINLVCREYKLDIPDLEVEDIMESALAKLARRFDYVPPDRQIRMLQVFDEERDLMRTFKRTADEVVTDDGQESPKQDQWPFAMPSEMQLELLGQLFKGAASEYHSDLRYTFRMTGYDAVKAAELLDLSDLLVTEKDDNVVKEFEDLLQQVPKEEREGARALLIANKYNIDATCTHLGIKRFPGKSKKKRGGKTINITGNFKKPPLPEPNIWPDTDACTPALLPYQMQHHPTVVDLHYFTLEDAREALQTFVKHHRRHNTGEVRIITGRGKNSADAKHTISKLVDNELKNMGVKFNRNPRNKGEIFATVRRI
uniref:Smr domain-containing protein n=1 Tax=Panagrellus redivivus TaxID=6233 RepID=A0A7E4VJY0_PANRE